MEQQMKHLEEASSAESPAFPSTFENVNNCKNNRQERRKGIPWTEDEHRRFLMGLHKYGKGDWRNISRNYVISRTPTQVASNAQKYYLRQLSEGKEKMKPSIHDTPTVNHTNAAPSNNCNFHHIRSLL